MRDLPAGRGRGSNPSRRSALPWSHAGILRREAARGGRGVRGRSRCRPPIHSRWSPPRHSAGPWDQVMRGGGNKTRRTRRAGTVSPNTYARSRDGVHGGIPPRGSVEGVVQRAVQDRPPPPAHEEGATDQRASDRDGLDLADPVVGAERPGGLRRGVLESSAKFSAFSAVSAPIFASKQALFSIF